MSNFITNDFDPSSAAAWKQKIQFDLKGVDYNETLLTNTNEGITIKPFYHQDDFVKLDIPNHDGDFKICQKINILNETEANSNALKAIKRGADSIKFIVEQPFKIKAVFENLLNKNIEFQFQLNFLEEKFIAKLMHVLNEETVFYNIDIIGNFSRNGNWFHSYKQDFSILENLLSIDQKNVLLGIDSTIYQNAGANIIQQTAYALAHANEYLTYFGSKTASNLQFNIAVGNNYFFEISKTRALRYLYNLILSSYNKSSTAIIFAEPSIRNKTLYDYNVNLLRTSTESMSAILGGANTISNLPYDALFHKPNDFGDHISLNQLHILKEESYFSNAQHFTTNSYYIEFITKQIAGKSLDLFKSIEKSGGFLQQLKVGTIQRKISENEKKEQQQFHNGELVLVGTNKYPNELDKITNDLEINPFSKKKSRKTLIIPITPKRFSEKLEQNRLKDEA